MHVRLGRFPSDNRSGIGVLCRFTMSAWDEPQDYWAGVRRWLRPINYVVKVDRHHA